MFFRNFVINCQLNVCYRKTPESKTESHKQIIFFSLKNHSVELFEKVLKKLETPNYKVGN